MKTHQTLYFNVTGQSLVWDAWEGRPSSVTSVSVYEAHEGDDAATEPATTGTASVEANPNTTVRATSGAGESDPTQINVNDDSGFSAGRVYLITDSDTRREWFETVAVDDSVGAEIVYSRYPLLNTYESGDAVVSTRISISVDSTWVADSNNITVGKNPGYRVRWEYVVDGDTYVHDSYFKLVRYRGDHQVTPDEVEKYLPGWLDELPTDERVDQGMALIDEAYDALASDLHAAGLSDEDARHAGLINRAVVLRSVYDRQRVRYFRGQLEADIYEEAKRDYHSFLEKLVTRSTKIPFATDTGGGGRAVQAQRLTRR